MDTSQLGWLLPASAYRAQAKLHREQAKRLRAWIREERERPMIRKDPIGRLRMQLALNERVRLAQEADRYAKAAKECGQ